ncbi:Ltp family lipoprotein [Hoeflea sp.]|uniref:Ltp family lipoprotein n=1 Tax=Hoeflea sp. TaxID=1940281 RepID=UPI003A9025EA
MNMIRLVGIAVLSFSMLGAPITSAQDLTSAQKNAVRSAKNYLSFQAFSRRGLIDQLSSPYGDDYDVADATAAVDSLSVDWNAQAVRSAKTYLEMMGFSCNGLIRQLSSDAGDKYTESQATYGAQQAGAC